MKIQFQPQGVCCGQMYVDISEDNTINEAMFYGGCNGNLQGVARLIQGMSVEEVISKLSGISCGGKGTSCPDQLARGLSHYLKMVEDGSISSTNF